ncbi:MAG: hypothetical protein MI976_05765 [Pseudomonadales bacterium]|nr:hypothetical protein [Pseudomonadales bacterium]
MSNKNKDLNSLAIATLTTALATAAPIAVAEIINYSDGSQYVGDIQNGKRHGDGRMQWTSGDSYEGSWRGDKPHGKGTKSYIDGSIYRGEFNQGIQQGKGTFTYPDGTTYTGDWRQDSPNGLGTFVFKDSGTYEGAISFGLPHGSGSFAYSNGDFYDGLWHHGKREGMGKLRFKNGNFYVGNFEDGVAQGTGTLTYANGERYKGSFAKGKPHGDGTCYKTKQQALCSFDNGRQVAYAVIPNYLAEEPPKSIATPFKPQPKPEPFTPPSVTTPAVTVASATVTTAIDNTQKAPDFVETLNLEKEKLKPHYTAEDLDQKRSDILFNHNFEKLNLAQALRTGWWRRHASLFSDHLKIHTRIGDLEVELKVKLFDGPGTYHIKSGGISASYKGRLLQGSKDFANVITIKKITNNWIEGNLNLSFQQKDNYGDFYKIENGVFRFSAQKPMSFN